MVGPDSPLHPASASGCCSSSSRPGTFDASSNFLTLFNLFVGRQLSRSPFSLSLDETERTGYWARWRVPSSCLSYLLLATALPFSLGEHFRPLRPLRLGPVLGQIAPPLVCQVPFRWPDSPSNFPAQLRPRACPSFLPTTTVLEAQPRSLPTQSRFLLDLLVGPPEPEACDPHLLRHRPSQIKPTVAADSTTLDHHST